MGSAFPFAEDESFDRKVKCMADEELLEIWEESQHLENMLNSGGDGHRYMLSPEYEKAILEELFLRRTKELRKDKTNAKSR